MNIDDAVLRALIEKTLVLEQAVHDILDALSEDGLDADTAIRHSRRLKAITLTAPMPQSES